MSSPESSAQVFSALDEEVAYTEAKRIVGVPLQTSLVREPDTYKLLFYGWELVLCKDGTYYLNDMGGG
jgi:hypothetical protein